MGNIFFIILDRYDHIPAQRAWNSIGDIPQPEHRNFAYRDGCTSGKARYMAPSVKIKSELKKDSQKITSKVIDPNTVGNGPMLEEFRAVIQQIRKDMKMEKPRSVPVTREFLKEMDKEILARAGEEVCFLACQELRPLEKMFLRDRRDLLSFMISDYQSRSRSPKGSVT